MQLAPFYVKNQVTYSSQKILGQNRGLPQYIHRPIHKHSLKIISVVCTLPDETKAMVLFSYTTER